MKNMFPIILISALNYSCNQQVKPIEYKNQTVDTVVIIQNSLLVKSKVDTLVNQNKTTGAIACGFEFSYEVDCDSSAQQIKSTLYYYPTTFKADSTLTFPMTKIASYYSDEKIVFVNIKHSEDRWESIKFERYIYVHDSIHIEEDLQGNYWDLPFDVREVIIKTIN